MKIRLSLLAIALAVIACQSATINIEQKTPTPQADPTSTKSYNLPAPTRSPNRGGWLDEIIVSVVAADAAVAQIQRGDLDIYASGLSSADLPQIQAAGLNYSKQYGLFYELTFNPVGPTFPATGKLNPFSSAKVREAMNWLVDRSYINQEIFAGDGLEKFLPITTQFPDYADLADVARRLEAKYAYDPDKANEVISIEMVNMGATKDDAGKWQFDGEPVTLIFLIRTDSDGTRVPIGDYAASQLERIGFTVDRKYRTSSESSPLWVGGNPADGKWHIYTGAWSATVIDRDQGDNFQFYYSSNSAYGFSPLWQAYTPSEEFNKLNDDLSYNRFITLDERRVAFARALELSLEDSVRVWLIDGKNFAPYDTNVSVAYDLAAGVDGAQLWPYTLRFTDREGGTLRWGQPDLFVDPWNPVSGSNWAFDASSQRATQSGGVMADPFTGLFHPLRIEKADVIVQEGLPVGATLDWVNLSFEPEIVVPKDAWADWDAAAHRFITTEEKYGEPVTAKVKSVVYYPADMLKTVKWHDGSNLSVADFIMGMIMTYDISKPESPIYDESRVANLENFLSIFKGTRIVSTDPLVIEYYTDAYQLDAEWNVTTWWPQYGYGEAPWHTIAIGNLADAAGELAYSADKADYTRTEWMSFIGGPSLQILNKYLLQADAETYIPYPETLGQYITPEEAAVRYANLKAWYQDHGHFWVGTGPYYLDRAYLNEKTLALKNNGYYPDASDRWSGFGEPKIAEVAINGAAQILIGQEATFDVFVTFEGAPYPQAEIKQVKYLLYNAQGEVVQTGLVEAVADGWYTITLPADVTALLSAGSSKLEVVVSPLPVTIPTFAAFEFLAAP